MGARGAVLPDALVDAALPAGVVLPAAVREPCRRAGAEVLRGGSGSAAIPVVIPAAILAPRRSERACVAPGPLSGRLDGWTAGS
ncbi:hypothetical protein, partial [Actinomyces bowdenii]|uniref:hypothetical protein n=1 Tax=Actinomyces bowdenii TaxID=131109 RepID=UPI001C54F8B0